MAHNQYSSYSLDPLGRARFYGVYKGIVTFTDDPLNQKRISIKVPQVTGADILELVSPTAPSDVFSSIQIPTVGAYVWVMFESGDPNYPVWMSSTETYVNIEGALGHYGAFSDYTDQYAGGSTTLGGAVQNTAAPLVFGQTDESNGVSITNNGSGKKTRITFAHVGTYNLQFSVQLENNGNTPHDVFIWLKKNGTDIAGSTGKVGIPARKNPGDPSHTIYGWNFVFTTTAVNDYYEFYWSTTSTDVSIQYYSIADNGSPTKPSTASIVLTATEVMNTQVGPAGPGVPAGGTTGQVLAKIDGTNYNTHWVTSSGSSGVSSVDGLTGAVTLSGTYAPLASPSLTGTPLTTTAAVDTNTTQIASTAFVLGQASASTPAMDGTAAVGTSTRYARADHIHGSDTSKAATNQTMYLGTTAVAINRASATGLSLAGVSIDGSSGSTTGNAATVTNGVYTTTTSLPNVTSASALATVGTITSGTWNAGVVPVLYGGTGLSFNDKTLVGRGTQLAGVNGSATGGTMTNAFQDTGTPKYILVDAASVYYYEAYFPITKTASTSAGSWQVSVIYQDTSGASLTPSSIYTAVNVWYSSAVETSVTSPSANTAISFGTAGTGAATRWMRLVGYITTHASTAGRMSIGFGQSQNYSSGTPSTPSTGANAFIAVYKMSTAASERVGNWA